MPRLRRIFRLLAVVVLAVTGTCAVVANSAAAEEPRDREPVVQGFDQKTMVEVCYRYNGRYLEDLPSPYRYGCQVPDGEIDCTEKAECFFFPIPNKLLPFEETCKIAGNTYKFDRFDKFGFFHCSEDKGPTIGGKCDPMHEVCTIGHEQPLPVAPPDEKW